MDLTVIDMEVERSTGCENAMSFLQPRSDENMKVREVILKGFAADLHALVPLALEAGAISLLAAGGTHLHSALGAAGVEGWVNVNQLYGPGLYITECGQIVCEDDLIGFRFCIHGMQLNGLVSISLAPML